MQNGHKMDSDEMLSGATTRTRRGTTLEMSNPESAIHDTPNRSLASTQEWYAPQQLCCQAGPAHVQRGEGCESLWHQWPYRPRTW